MAEITRRRFLEGGLVLGAATAGCGRTEVFEDEVVEEVVVPPIGLAEGGPEDDMKNPAYIPAESTPVHVTASASLQSNTSAGVNTIALRNPMETPMEILEVKWQIRMERANFLGSAVLGGIIGCKLDLGKIPLTNGYVPVWNFGRSIDPIRETPADVSGLGVVFHTWRLAHPLYIPVGAVLSPTFQHRGLFPNDITVQVSYSGRSLPAGYRPKKVRLPYVAAYVSKSFYAGTSDTDASTETDLMNPFDEALELHALTGRMTTVYSADLDGSSERSDPYLSSEAMQLRMRDSTGRDVVKSYTPFRTVFPWTTRAWEFAPGFFLDPKSFYITNMKFTTQGLGDGNIQRYLQSSIGLVGSREVA